MKHTHTIQWVAMAAVLVPGYTWAQAEVTPAERGSPLRFLAEPLGNETGNADGGDQVEHSQQRVSTFMEPSGDVAPASADQMMMMVNRAIDIVLTGGVAYDSNPLLAPVGDPEWVTWANLRFLLNPEAFGNPGRGFYYGLNMGSSVFSYGTGAARGGRDQGEFDVTVFTGVRGAKTDVRFTADYRLNNGNLIDFSNLDREARRADSDDLDLSVSASRKLDHSMVTGLVRWSERNFSPESGLNDTTSMMGDVGWLFEPGFAPKTQLGAGFRAGDYNTDRSVSQNFYEPTFRFRHRATAKSSFHGRVGYTFIDYNDSPGATGDDGFFSFSGGWDWAPTFKTGVGLQAYRQFSPSYTAANQNYITDGVSLVVTQFLPKGWSLRTTVALESAEYFSTVQGVATTRQDDYWRVGGDLSHALNLFRGMQGQISAFYYYNANDSSEAGANFDQAFTGMKIGLSY